MIKFNLNNAKKQPGGKLPRNIHLNLSIDNEIMEIVYIRKVEGIPGANIQNTLKAAKTWEEDAAT